MKKRHFFKRLLLASVGSFAFAAVGTAAYSFCGFYVGKADTKLFNEASKVVLVRDGDRTVITMANDYQGELTEFAMVIPVPTVLQEGQIHVTENGIIDHLDAYSAPRLVEYFDEDPCMTIVYKESATMGQMAEDAPVPSVTPQPDSLGVTVEAEYTVGEYDIVILSALESDGLETWLTDNGYKIPDGAAQVLESYVKQGTKFFVAKVNLEEQAQTGLKYLRPIQIAFESPKFMLPIRLGMINSNGKQELFVFALTREGKVETTNYRTTALPSGMDIPLYVKGEFGNFYKDMFAEQVEKEGGRTVFTEYAWDMNWCDPCAADPLSDDELRELGVYWVGDDSGDSIRQVPLRQSSPSRARDVFITRLHISYDKEHFPEDLKFKTTGDRQNFQSRYVLRHPFTGEATCEAAENYFANLPKRFEREAQTLANLTGWDIQTIRDQMADNEQEFEEPEPKGNWWQRLWGNG